MMYDGLYCAFDQVPMGAGTEKYAQAHDLPRDRQDAFAAESHRRADAAQQAPIRRRYDRTALWRRDNRMDSLTGLSDW